MGGWWWGWKLVRLEWWIVEWCILKLGFWGKYSWDKIRKAKTQN